MSRAARTHSVRVAHAEYAARKSRSRHRRKTTATRFFASDRRSTCATHRSNARPVLAVAHLPTHRRANSNTRRFRFAAAPASTAHA